MYSFTGEINRQDQVAFEGIVTLHDYPDVIATLNAQADSCGGDSGFPTYCRVKAGAEGNNLSSSIGVVLYPS